MMVIVSYDVSVVTQKGRRRLRRPSQDGATPHWSLRNLYIARVPSAELGLALAGP